MPINIIGVYNIFELTHQFGCERMIFASSVNSVNNYLEKTIKDNVLPNPRSLYGATKVWGEALAKLYSTENDLSSICIRFVRVVDPNDERISLKNNEEGNPDKNFPGCDRLITFEDSAQLIAKSIEAPKSLKFFIAHGVSDNKKKRLSLKETKKVLGYKPKDDSFKLAIENR